MIVADESLNARFIRRLRQEGHEVLSITEHSSGITDAQVLKIARSKNALLLSEDKDFGTWVFAHHVDDVDIILVRYAEHQEMETLQTLVDFLKSFSPQTRQQFITIGAGKVRHRVL